MMSKMKKVYFSPYAAIRFIAQEEQEFTRSLARPKPIVEKGDICIITKKDAYNLCKLFPDHWEEIKEDFVELEQLSLEDAVKLDDMKQKEEELNSEIQELKEKLQELESENEELAIVVAKLDLEEDETKLPKEEEENSSIKESEGTDEENLPKQDEVTIRPREKFKNKQPLEEYAREFEIELDARQTIDNMYEAFVKALKEKGILK